MAQAHSFCSESFSKKKTDEQKVFFALPATYDCCSECRESYPERGYYSEKSFEEEVFDSKYKGKVKVKFTNKGF